jgi:uncharacterized protein YqeY
MKDEIQQQLKEAMLARDDFKKTVLTGLKSAITYAEKAKKSGGELSDEDILAVVAKEVKSRDDAIEIYTSAGDKDRAEKEAAEREILAAFLPTPLTDDELAELIERVITTTGASSAGDMGRVIGAVKKEAGAKADGARIAKMVREKIEKLH